MRIHTEPFGTTADGRAVEIFTLDNGRGMTVSVTTYGCIVTGLWVPDRHGERADVVLGFSTLAEYLAGHPYFGALVGRYANRIAGGSFSLDGRAYTLAGNDHGHHLHGGVNGFDKALWQARPRQDAAGVGVELHYLSRDGEEGYPGELSVAVTYLLTAADELRITYRAATDRATPINLTHHGYFNLAGAGNGDILNHVLTLAADTYTLADAAHIPTGEVAPVDGTPLDFRRPKRIGEEIGCLGEGYDHNFILRRERPGLVWAARVHEPRGGRVMEMWTSEPAVQFYTGNFLDGSLRGKGGHPYPRHGGFCLEAQHYPDSPHHPHFPSTILRPGETYHQETVYRFSHEVSD